MHAEAEIRFECSQCGQHLSVDASAAGLTTVCPSCHGTLVVPEDYVLTRIAAITNSSGTSDDTEGWHGHIPETVESESSALREQLVDATRTRARMERDLAAARLEIESLQSQIDYSAAENNRLVASSEEILSKNAELAALQSDLLKQNEELQQRLAAQQAELTKQSEESKELKESMAKNEERRAGLTEELALVRTESEKLRQRIATLEPFETEVVNLRKDLAASKEAQECNRLRVRAETAEAGEVNLRRDLETVRTEIEDRKKVETDLRRELEDAKQRIAALGKQLQELAESKVKADNDVLRAILGRQKIELENCYSDLKRFRRAQLGLRLVYALFALGLLGIAAFALHVLPDISEIL